MKGQVFLLQTAAALVVMALNACLNVGTAPATVTQSKTVKPSLPPASKQTTVIPKPSLLPGQTSRTIPALPLRTARAGSPLDEETLNDLALDMSRTVQMQPGESRQFSLGVIQCCVIFEPVQAQAAWSVSPSRGAHIDAATGVLTVEPTVASGSVFTVSANVENGRRIVSINVHVFTVEANPFAKGMWEKEAQFECDSGKEANPPQLIRELRFGADGSFSVTWVPFEVYRDYWGSYTYDLEQGTFELTVAGGNYVPRDVDGSGRFSIDDRGRLNLNEMWLGSPRDSKTPPNCGHRFVPSRR